jgi:hypothetical protein
MRYNDWLEELHTQVCFRPLDVNYYEALAGILNTTREQAKRWLHQACYNPDPYFWS